MPPSLLSVPYEFLQKLAITVVSRDQFALACNCWLQLINHGCLCLQVEHQLLPGARRIFEAAFPGGQMLKGVLAKVNSMCTINC